MRMSKAAAFGGGGAAATAAAAAAVRARTRGAPTRIGSPPAGGHRSTRGPWRAQGLSGIVRVPVRTVTTAFKETTMSFRALARARALVLLPILVLPTGGCITFETLVKVKPDGSGTV